jgi:hypothetical protein
MNHAFRTALGHLVHASAALLFCAPAAGQVLFNPANGHYYEAVADLDVDWAIANTKAQSSEYAGFSGYLASVTSAQENDFITAAFPQAPSEGYWLGGFQAPGSAEPAGGWGWTSGEPWLYANWAPNEPNNDGNATNETALHYVPDSDQSHVSGQWNDLDATKPPRFYYQPGGYIVEYSALPAVPEPATVLLAAVGMAAVYGRRTLRRLRPV